MIFSLDIASRNSKDDMSRLERYSDGNKEFIGSIWKDDEVEINTLEELMTFVDKCGTSVIICGDPTDGFIEVYDYYVE